MNDVKRSIALLALVATISAPSIAAAGETCTIAYRVAGKLTVTDTYLGKGDTTVPATGSLVLELTQDSDGQAVDGKVKILHLGMKEQFVVDTIADITTTIHHYAPLCNGVDEPAWRRPSDEGFPKRCSYDGNRRAVATGHLRRADGVIDLAKCKAAPTYWAKDRNAYRPSDKSKGRGCVERMHSVGNIHCDGRLACKLGRLEAGDNPQFARWTQPLLQGPRGEDGVLLVSTDLRTIRTPKGAPDGYESFNLPNDSPSRTWFSFVATRNDASRFTTCR